MALCWPVTPSEVKFAVDSLLEGERSRLISAIVTTGTAPTEPRYYGSGYNGYGSYGPQYYGSDYNGSGYDGAGYYGYGR
jgi:hypothetical protein